MNKRIVSLLLPYNNKFEIIMQRRKGFVNKPVDVDYGFFGGGLEGNETVEQTLKREIKEELNLDLENIKSLQFFKQYQYEVKEKNLLVELHVFLCKMKEVEKMEVNEGKPAILNLKKAINLNISKMDKQILEEVYTFLSKNRNYYQKN